MDYSNILNVNKEEVIKEVINKTKSELDGLTKERTCKVYSDYISHNLHLKNILHRNIDTKDFDYNYSHKFCIVPNEEDYYLIDLTYSQFNNFEFVDLLIDGYTDITKDELKRYMDIVGKSKKDINIDTLLFGKGRSK